MAHVEVEVLVEAPVKNVWESWDQYADIEQFHPDLRGSFLVDGSAPTGLGALRQCDFLDGKTFIREKIIGYQPERQLMLDIYEGNLPLKRAIATIEMSPVGASKTRLRMEIEFIPKMGIIGKMLQPVMKKQFSKALMKLLQGNAQFVERIFAERALVSG